jgi:hypothetical protein
MIIAALCNGCLQRYDLSMEPGDTDLMKTMMDDSLTVACPRLCGGRINVVNSVGIMTMASTPGLKQPMSLTARELFRAVNGGGLPSEIVKDPVVIQALLKSSPVVEAVVEEVNGKVYLHELKLAVGTTIHLASGLRGAQVLKITKET